MLKVRVIPILTFNGFGLVKTKRFSNPRMVGNPVQAARVFNARGVDELAFVDIMATRQKRKLNLNLVRDVIKECFMPVSIGGGVETIDDINNLLRIGADKVIIKTKALTDPGFIREAVRFFGSQCISIAADVINGAEGYMIQNELGLSVQATEFLREVEGLGAGEVVLTSVDHDGMMEGFDTVLVRTMQAITNVPVIAVGGAGKPAHFSQLLAETNVEAVGAASLYHFTQFTPLDVKKELAANNKPVRLDLQ
ncbi:MAG: imidazole glycerol phosphate synthase subunit HisF [Chitinophagaceae bacterium]|nr:MAG: imidazole glycerol phosphate synthase subunit HisF [Chitinophagaceae bacterium]